jgi:hypothetical protein
LAEWDRDAMTTGRQALTGMLLLSLVILIAWLIEFQLPIWVISSAMIAESPVLADSPTVIRPELFSEFWGIWIFYVISPGLVTSVMFFILGAFGLTMFSVVARQLTKLGARIIRFGAILIILLPVGGLFNAFWCCLVSGNLYWAQDVDSPEDDFSPFLPINSTDLTAEHGYLLSGSIHQLQLVWLFFAATTWAISYIIYRLVRQQIAKLILRQAQDDRTLETKNSVNSVCLP